MKKAIATHPILFSLFPLLFLWAHNVTEVTLSDAALPLIIVPIAALGIHALMSLALKNTHKAAVLTSFFVLLFFSYGPVMEVLRGIKIGDFSPGRDRYLLLAWPGLFSVALFAMISFKGSLNSLTKLLNVVAVCLVLTSFLPIVSYEIQKSGLTSGGQQPIAESSEPLKGYSPDIYYIVMDGYASSRTLQDVFDYDNSPFLSYLSENGFHVPEDSRSNYALTFLSLASSLNMKYLSDLSAADPRMRAIPYDMIENNAAANFLRSKGYQFIHFRSGWGGTNKNQNADRDIQCGVSNEYLMVLLQSTMLAPFERSLNLFGDNARERILCVFDTLADLPKIKGPKFVFAHILCPHPPYLFDADGGPVHDAQLEMDGAVWSEKHRYVDQLVFINKKIQALIKSLLSESQNPPIILLQADHGSDSSLGNPRAGTWETFNKDQVRERMTIFNAYYLPGMKEDLVYTSISPVNSFRLIFNNYFGADFALLEDRSLYSTYKQPYTFVDVTDMLVYA